MRFFYDTEFIDNGRTIELISIGVAAEDGREYYAISTEFNPDQAGTFTGTDTLDYDLADADSSPPSDFDRWAADRRGSAFDPLSVERGGPPPTRDIPGQSFSKPPPLPQGGIIGLFPEPGGQR